MFHHWELWLCLGVLLCGGAYIGLTYFTAWAEVKAQPREPMFECEKHGIFREEHLVEFLDDKWCPMCINERIGVPLDSSVFPQ